MAEKKQPDKGYLQNGTSILDIHIWRVHRGGILDAPQPVAVEFAGEEKRRVNGQRRTIYKWTVIEGGFSLRSSDNKRYIEKVATGTLVEGQPVILITPERNVLVEDPADVKQLPPIPLLNT